MPMIDFQPQPVTTKQFVVIWSARYYYDRSVEELYEKNIGQELTEERVLKPSHCDRALGQPRRPEGRSAQGALPAGMLRWLRSPG